jgi:carboxyl-terminal processing protease
MLHTYNQRLSVGISNADRLPEEFFMDVIQSPFFYIRPLAFLIVLFSGHQALSQSFRNQDRDRGVTMLKTVKEDIRKNYYDPNFHGIDLDARFKVAEEKMKLTNSNAEVFGIIAQTLIDFNDSHTAFLPPSRSARVEYGWLMKMVADNCYVTEVRPHSDADTKGLKPGDLVQSIDGIQPTRANTWVFYYLYYQLAPRPSINVVVQSPGEQPRHLELKAKVQTGPLIVDLTEATGIEIHRLEREEEDEEILNASRFKEFGDDLIIWKLPQFSLEKSDVDERINRVKKHQALILDLRDNGGGAEETLLRLIGNLCDHDVTIGEIKRRKESKPLVAKTRGNSGFKGKLVVLVDSDSASASELLARVVQLERRGVVLGDRTGGKVMRSRVYGHEMGLGKIVVYAAQVTDADIVMPDGHSLEHAGVTPNLILLPTAGDLRSGRDPVLSGAASLLGVKLNPAEAGKFFPFKWKP